MIDEAKKAKRALYLRKITQSLLNLPTLPTIHARLIEMVDHPHTTASQLGDLILEDQVLTAKLIKMCNSAYYGLTSEVHDVRRAIVLLGFDIVREIGLGVSVLNFFKRDGGSSSTLDLAKFWEHSAVVGIAAKLIAKKYFPQFEKEAFIAGLLHDLGKVILLQYLPEDFNAIVQEARQGDRYLYEIETDFFSVHHGIIGSWLGVKWKLPESVTDCMQFHHQPMRASQHKELLACVVLGNIIAQAQGMGHSGNWKSIEIQDNIRLFLNEFAIFGDFEEVFTVSEDLPQELERAMPSLKALLDEERDDQSNQSNQS